MEKTQRGTRTADPIFLAGIAVASTAIICLSCFLDRSLVAAALGYDRISMSPDTAFCFFLTGVWLIIVPRQVRHTSEFLQMSWSALALVGILGLVLAASLVLHLGMPLAVALLLIAALATMVSRSVPYFATLVSLIGFLAAATLAANELGLWGLVSPIFSRGS